MLQLEVFLDNPIITTGSNNMRTKQGNQNGAGNSMEAEIPDGHVMWNEAWTHQVENIGSSDLKAIIVESKK